MPITSVNPGTEQDPTSWGAEAKNINDSLEFLDPSTSIIQNDLKPISGGAVQAALANKVNVNGSNRLITSTEGDKIAAASTSAELSTALALKVDKVAGSSLITAQQLADLQAMKTLIIPSSADTDTVINAFNEVIAIFENSPEGFNIAQAMALKLDAATFTAYQTAVTSALALKVNTSTTVNGKALNANVTLATDDLTEGPNNKYFTESRVLATILAGISFVTNSAVSATDSLLAALGKLQAQISVNVTAISNKVAKVGDSLTGALNEAKGVDLASAATVDIGAATGNTVHITGTSSITSFGTIQAGTRRTVVFDGTLTLTNSANLILPGSANLVTSAGDVAVFVSEGAGVWRCASYLSTAATYTSYSPSYTGFSSIPTTSGGNARYRMVGRKTCHVITSPSAAGISNAAATTITLPFPAANAGTQGQICPILVLNSGTFIAGYAQTQLGSNIANIKQGAFADFATTGNKSIYLNIMYEIEL